jgi:heat shock protein HslJ
MGMRNLLTATFVTLALVACGATDEASSPDGEWIAVSAVADGSSVELVDGFAVTIGLDGDAVVGTAACNRYSGAIVVGSDGSFEASELSWTEIGCEPAVQEVERAYLTSLSNFANYSVADDVLTLSGDSDEWVFQRSAATG